jgi:hypothetical protein
VLPLRDSAGLSEISFQVTGFPLDAPRIRAVGAPSSGYRLLITALRGVYVRNLLSELELIYHEG